MDAILMPADDTTTCHPLTIKRCLSDILVGGTTLQAAQIAALETAGFEHVHIADGDDLMSHSTPGDSPRLAMVGDVWLAPVDLRRLRRHEATTLVDPDDGSQVCSISGLPDADTVIAPMCGESFRIRHPWDFLKLNEILLANLTESDTSAGTVSPAANVEGVLVIGEGTRILPGVYVEGNVSIGKDCKIGPNCYLRGPTTIGDGCHIGQAVEIKASIIMGDTSIAHLSYVGDSIVGKHSNFGAGTITANLRHDGSNNRSMVQDELVDTGRRKLGTIVGDHVHLGINTSIYPGRKIWPHGVTVPGEIVTRDIVTEPEPPPEDTLESD